MGNIIFSLLRTMDGLPPDQGKLASPGYINADPPNEPVFALTAGGSGYASEIQQAGGSVAVDGFGGINLTVPGGAFLGLDSFNNITLNTSTTTGVITLRADGAGHDVNIYQAGTIAFDTVGAGAITNLQTINGVVYPPPGGGGGTSITQAGALVACLGNGGVTISSIGAGVTVDVTNAGTIAFDTLGSKAITGLSTINGSAYPPPAYVLPSDLTVSTLTAANYVSTTALQGVSSINGSAYPPASYVLPADITVSTLTAATYVDAASYINVSSISGAGSVSITGSDIYLVDGINTGLTVVGSVTSLNGVSSITGNSVSLYSSGSDITMIADSGLMNLTNGTGLQTSGNIVPSFDNTFNVGLVGQAWADVYATNGYFSTINGSAYPPASYVLPADITVSTLTAATYVDAASYINVSSISGAGSVSITGSDIYLVDGINVGLTVVGSVTSLNGVSSITGGNVSIASTAGDLTMSADSGLMSLINNTGIQASANIVPSADASINLGIAGQAWNDVYATNGYFSTLNGAITLTNSNITSGTLEATAGIVLDGAATLTINGSTGAEGNVVAISGGYPAWVEPAVMPSGVITNADIIGATWDGVGTLGQYAYSFNIGVTLNSAAVVQVATWESDADEASTYWVVSSGLDSGLLRIVLAGNPVAVTNYNLSWVVLSNAGSPP